MTKTPHPALPALRADRALLPRRQGLFQKRGAGEKVDGKQWVAAPLGRLGRIGRIFGPYMARAPKTGCGAVWKSGQIMGAGRGAANAPYPPYLPYISISPCFPFFFFGKKNPEKNPEKYQKNPIRPDLKGLKSTFGGLAQYSAKMKGLGHE